MEYLRNPEEQFTDMSKNIPARYVGVLLRTYTNTIGTTARRDQIEMGHLRTCSHCRHCDKKELLTNDHIATCRIQERVIPVSVIDKAAKGINKQWTAQRSGRVMSQRMSATQKRKATHIGYELSTNMASQVCFDHKQGYWWTGPESRSHQHLMPYVTSQINLLLCHYIIANDDPTTQGFARAGQALAKQWTCTCNTTGHNKCRAATRSLPRPYVMQLALNMVGGLAHQFGDIHALTVHPWIMYRNSLIEEDAPFGGTSDNIPKRFRMHGIATMNNDTNAKVTQQMDNDFDEEAGMNMALVWLRLTDTTKNIICQRKGIILITIPGDINNNVNPPNITRTLDRDHNARYGAKHPPKMPGYLQK